MRTWLAIAVLTGCACRGDKADADGDGWRGEDCDDTDPDVHPGVDELCDGRDQDCDGEVDEGVVVGTRYADLDNDGLGDPENPLDQYCVGEETGVTNTDDCDDLDPDVLDAGEVGCGWIDAGCSSGAAQGAEALVGGQGYTRVRFAVMAAEEGATVEVCPGTHDGRIRVDRDVTIWGPDGAAEHTLDGGDVGAVIEVRGGTLTLQQLTLTGGRGTERDGQTRGGGVDGQHSQGLIIEDCLFDTNRADHGAGVLGSELGTTIVSNTEFFGNRASVSGGGLLVWHASVASSTFGSNWAADGAAIAVAEGGMAELTEVTAQNNRATNNGAVGWVDDGATLSIVGATFDGNRAERYAGGIYADPDATVVLEDVLFDNNQSDNKGGAFYGYSATFDATDVSVLGHIGRWGGAAMLYDTAFTGTRLQILYNSAELGGAFYVYMGSTLSLTDSEVLGNVVPLSGGGGGARIKDDSSLVSLSTDWGEGDDDNIPNDVEVEDGQTYEDIDSDFTCSNESGGCE